MTAFTGKLFRKMKMESSQIVAVTGGGGFIGLKLVERLLQAGYRVRVLSRCSRAFPITHPQLEVVCGDLLNTHFDLSLFLHSVETLFHCAGEIREESRMHALHVEATERLIEAAKDQINHWVQLSSVGVYGRPASGLITEQSKIDPVGIYEQTKAKSDELVHKASLEKYFSCSILRPVTVYGFGMPGNSLAGLYRTIKRRLFFFIGSREASANLVHVDNVVEALICCGRNRSNSATIYNLCDAGNLHDVVNVIAQTVGVTASFGVMPKSMAIFLAIVLGKLPGFPLTREVVEYLSTTVVYQSHKIKHETNYQERVDLQMGLTDLIDQWQAG